jgi:ribosomal protein L7/L12
MIGYHRFTLLFFKSPSKNGTDARSPLLKPALEKADRFHALLVNALRNHQRATPSIPNTTNELQRLWELKTAGALSDDEFAAQKARLLSGALTSTCAMSTEPPIDSALQKSEYGIVVVDFGPKDINVARVVCSITGTKLVSRVFKGLMQNTSTEVLTANSKEEAERYRDQLQAAGASS